MIAALQQASSIEWRARDVLFDGARPGGPFDAARRFPCVGIQKHVQPGDGTFIIFPFATHITNPCRETWDRNQFLTQPREVCDVTQMHHTCSALTTGRGIRGREGLWSVHFMESGRPVRLRFVVRD